MNDNITKIDISKINISSFIISKFELLTINSNWFLIIYSIYVQLKSD